MGQFQQLSDPVFAPRAKRESRGAEMWVTMWIWIAVCVYVLVTIVKKRLEIPTSLCTTLETLSLT